MSQRLLPSVALIAQKTTIEYCRVKAGPAWRKLFNEAEFQDALQASLAAAWGYVLDDLLTVLATALARVQAATGAAPDRQGAVRDAVLDAVVAMRQAMAAQAPDVVRPVALSDEAAFRARLADAITADASATDIAATSGKLIYKALPLHRDFVRYDREVVVNHIRFTMLGEWERVLPSLDCASLVSGIGRAAPVQ